MKEEKKKKHVILVTIKTLVINESHKCSLMVNSFLHRSGDGGTDFRLTLARNKFFLSTVKTSKQCVSLEMV